MLGTHFPYIVASVLGLFFLATGLALVVYFRHYLWKLCPFKRCQTGHTGIARRFSWRYSQPWVLQGLIAQGRYSQVYKALYNGEVVAVKVYSHHRYAVGVASGCGQ